MPFISRFKRADALAHVQDQLADADPFLFTHRLQDHGTWSPYKTQHPPLSRTTGADLGSGMFVDVFEPFDSFNKNVRHNLVDFEN